MWVGGYEWGRIDLAWGGAGAPRAIGQRIACVSEGQGWHANLERWDQLGRLLAIRVPVTIPRPRASSTRLLEGEDARSALFPRTAPADVAHVPGLGGVRCGVGDAQKYPGVGAGARGAAGGRGAGADRLLVDRQSLWGKVCQSASTRE